MLKCDGAPSPLVLFFFFFLIFFLFLFSLVLTRCNLSFASYPNSVSLAFGDKTGTLGPNSITLAAMSFSF